MIPGLQPEGSSARDRQADQDQDLVKAGANFYGGHQGGGVPRMD